MPASLRHAADLEGIDRAALHAHVPDLLREHAVYCLHGKTRIERERERRTDIHTDRHTHTHTHTQTHTYTHTHTHTQTDAP
jgi:hypothetical protein